MEIRIVKMKGRWRDKRKILMLIVVGKWKSEKEEKKVRENVTINYKINK